MLTLENIASGVGVNAKLALQLFRTAVRPFLVVQYQSDHNICAISSD